MRDHEAALLPRPCFADTVDGPSPQRDLLARAVALISGPTDADLLASYERTGGEQGNPEADALLGEIERRGLDV